MEPAPKLSQLSVQDFQIGDDFLITSKIRANLKGKKGTLVHSDWINNQVYLAVPGYNFLIKLHYSEVEKMKTKK